MSLDVFQDNEWGPWEYSRGQSFQTGDLLILDCWGEIGTGFSEGVYKVVDSRPKEDGEIILNRRDSYGSWTSGHTWNFECETTKIRRFKVAGKTSPASAVAVNDYVCPRCKNERCSKSEIKCWRCGEKL